MQEQPFIHQPKSETLVTYDPYNVPDVLKNLFITRDVNNSHQLHLHLAAGGSEAPIVVIKKLLAEPGVKNAMLNNGFTVLTINDYFNVDIATEERIVEEKSPGRPLPDYKDTKEAKRELEYALQEITFNDDNASLSIVAQEKPSIVGHHETEYKHEYLVIKFNHPDINPTELLRIENNTHNPGDRGPDTYSYVLNTEQIVHQVKEKIKNNGVLRGFLPPQT